MRQRFDRPPSARFPPELPPPTLPPSSSQAIAPFSFFFPLSIFPIKSIHQSRSRTKVQLLASFSGILTQRPAVTFAFRLKFNLSSTVSVSITIMSSITSHRCVLFCKTASMLVEDLFSRLLLARRASAMMVWFLSLAAKRSSHLVIAVMEQKLTMQRFLAQ